MRLAADRMLAMRRRRHRGQAVLRIADSCRSGRRARLISPMAISRWSTAKRAEGTSYGPGERARWHSMLTYIAHERNYKPGWAAHKYKEKFGTWPRRRASPSRSHRRPKSAHGCARARSPTRREGSRHEEARIATTHRIVGQFVPRTIVMLRSPAFRALSLSGHRILAASRSSSPTMAAGITANCR